MRSYSDREEEKTKAETAITRYIASKASFSWRGWAVIETSLATSFFLFLFFFFFFLTFSIRSVMNSQGSRVFHGFFFHFFFFFQFISNCLFVGRFYVAGNEFVLKGLPDVHIYIYIYIHIRSIRTRGVLHANRWWRWWPSVFNKLSDRCTCQIAMNQRVLLFQRSGKNWWKKGGGGGENTCFRDFW